MSNKNLAIAYAAKRRSKVDRANFLSDEDKVSELNFPEAASDEELLDESGFNPPDEPLDNRDGNEDQDMSRSEMVAQIMRKKRMMR